MGTKLAFTQGGIENAFFLTVAAVQPFTRNQLVADPGNRFIAVDVALQGSSGAPEVSAFDFTVTDDEGHIYEIEAMYKDPALPFDIKLAPNKKVRGWLVFQIPKAMKAGAIAFADSAIAFTVK